MRGKMNVRRGGKLGATLWIIAPVQFLVSVIFTWLGWTTSYGLLTNTISDLGAVGCGNWTSGAAQNGSSATSHYVCSPWHGLFNASIIILGLLSIIGAMLLIRRFPPRPSSKAGLVMIAIGGFGAVGVGVFPEDVSIIPHSIFALLQFVFGNLGLLTLGYAMVGQRVWRRYEVVTIACGIVGLVAFPLFLSGFWGPLGIGGSEWLIVGPELVWVPFAGIRLLQIPDSTA
ncbi:MAG TPA: DUF998 domain-containing protein [Candidatus Bathyarchaeia archaeon]|nr:DUF998 domain-containing protein [Candidatus Bathyarchaeia archaeon]